MIGHSVNDVYEAAARLGNTRLGSIPGNLVGAGGMHPLQRAMGKDVRNLANMIPGVSSKAAVHAGRFAGRAVPLLSALANVQDVSQIISGNESFANKAMDTAAMATGAAIGGVLGGGVFSPLTASIGASTGKMISDGTQWLFGDKKSPEQRRAEEMARSLYGGMG
jgi:hypothetical protein